MTNDVVAAAVAEAKLGLQEGGFPIGAVLVLDGEVVGSGRNRRFQQGSCIFHAITDCLERAGRFTAKDYRRSALYTTLSPCDMCAGAILLYRINRVVIGDNRHFRGPENHLEVLGVRVQVCNDAKCGRLLDQYVKNHQILWKKCIELK